MRKFLYKNSLSLVLVLITVGLMGGHALAGWHEFNGEQRDFGQAAIGLGAYLTTGHFIESLFENWESEFLQIGAYVLLTIWLRQKDAADSKQVDGSGDEVDREPDPTREGAPWPVRRGAVALPALADYCVFCAIPKFVLPARLRGGAQPQPRGGAERKTSPRNHRFHFGVKRVMVSIARKLAKRISVGRGARAALDLPAAARLAGIETGGHFF